MCTVYSDRHYHTFDGLEYDYHTDCQVYLLKVSLLPPINVISTSFFFFGHALAWLRMWPSVLDKAVVEVFMSDRGAEECVVMLASKVQCCGDTKRPVFTSNPEAPALPGI